jgi:hypothetical protein
LFLTPGELSNEIIISVIQSQAQGVFNNIGDPKGFLPRNVGGFGGIIPTWSLMDSYECKDGLPIDESPLYNPRNPFSNRDPRLSQTIVPFSSNWLDYSYQPHPDSVMVMNYKTGAMVRNNDTRTVATFASYTGLLWKKGIDKNWVDKLAAENDIIIVRFAEMLLTYAEAKIELNEIDASVLNAINQVRARGYGVKVNETTLYPAITTTSPEPLKSIVKRERRVEFANEGLRYMDLVRWRIAEVALTKPVIGLPDPAVQNRAKWPFPGVPSIDINGIPDYSAFSADIKMISQRNFDKNKQYLWPVPSAEIRVNPDLAQNPNY